MRAHPAHDAFFRFACEFNAACRGEPALWVTSSAITGYIRVGICGYLRVAPIDPWPR